MEIKLFFVKTTLFVSSKESDHTRNTPKTLKKFTISEDMLTVEFLALVGVLIFLLWILCKKPSGLPPGRWGLPLVGYIPMKSKYIDDLLKDFQNQYGDMYIWRVGTQVLLFIHDYHLVRQIFSSPDFVDRPDWVIFKGNEKTALGIAFSNNPIWQTNRRFSIHQLKDLGMGKSSLSLAVQTQASKLVEALKEDAGEPAPIPAALNTAVVNIIWQMVANKQFEKDDPRLLEFKRLIEEFGTSGSAMIIPDIFPWVRTILPNFLLRKFLRMDLFEEVLEKFLAYFDELIEEHREALDPDDPKDLIDAYLIEMDNSQNNDSFRSVKDLTYLIFDMFVGGSDTTVNTLKWIFLYLADNPRVQQRLQEEIEDALPKDTLPTMDDRSKLQFTEAVINEALRKSALANTGLQHVAAKDTQLFGYRIPKGTICMAAVDSIHHDPRYWDEPLKFRPERWMDADGKVAMKKEGFLPFSIGKRSCIGESLARLELLIFTVAVLRSFSISPPEGETVDLRPDPHNQLGHDPIKQDVVFTLRENEEKA